MTRTQETKPGRPLGWYDWPENLQRAAVENGWMLSQDARGNWEIQRVDDPGAWAEERGFNMARATLGPNEPRFADDDGAYAHVLRLLDQGNGADEQGMAADIAVAIISEHERKPTGYWCVGGIEWRDLPEGGGLRHLRIHEPDATIFAMLRFDTEGDEAQIRRAFGIVDMLNHANEGCFDPDERCPECGSTNVKLSSEEGGTYSWGTCNACGHEGEGKRFVQ